METNNLVEYFYFELHVKTPIPTLINYSTINAKLDLGYKTL